MRARKEWSTLAEPRPEYRAVTAEAATVASDVLFVPVFTEKDQLEELGWLAAATGGEIARARTSGEFTARLFDVFVASAAAGSSARRVALVGAGQAADATAERLRRIGATCGYAARRYRA